MPLFRRPASSPELYDLFDEAGSNILRGADLLGRLLQSWPDDAGLAREILVCEQEGDRITHDIIHRLSAVSAESIAGSDLFALALALDDVVDLTEEVADFLGLYKIEAPMEQAQQLATVLRDASASLATALARLRDPGESTLHLVEVHRLENEGDRISREAIASLFAGGVDPVVIICWKDVFERLEQAIDACEHAAHILEGIALQRG